MNRKKLYDVYPLSPMQSGLLFQSLYAPESDTYFVQTIFKLQGEIRPTTLKQAWQIITTHYPIMRTGILWRDLL